MHNMILPLQLVNERSDSDDRASISWSGREHEERGDRAWRIGTQHNVVAER